MMKKIIYFCLCLCLLFSVLSGCENAPVSTETTPTMETTEPAPRELTEEEKAILQERRETVESHMREALSVLWKADKNIVYGLSDRDNGLMLHLIEDRIYRGLPYAYAVGTRDSFLEYAGQPDEHGVYTISGLEDTAVNYESYGARVGNDCSGALTNGWSQIGTSFDASRSCEMSPLHGVIPVGDYLFNPTIDESNGNITNTGVCTAHNGPLTMYNAYAQLRKGDAVFYVEDSGTNHCRMIVDVNVVYAGNVVDGTKSTVTVLEQTRKFFTQQKTEAHPELGEVFVIGGIDQVYTFAQLFNGTYLPVTVKELVDPSPVEETWVKDTLEDEPTLDNLFTGSITSNRYIDAVRITVTNENGEVVQQVAGRTRRSFNKDFEMERFVTEKPGSAMGFVDPDALEPGSYHCTVALRLTIEDDYEHVMRDFDFTK